MKKLKPVWVDLVPEKGSPFADAPLGDDEAEAVAAVWRDAGCRDVEVRDGGVIVTMRSALQLEVRKNRIAIHGDPGDEAVRAVVGYIRKHWAKRVALTGTAAFKLLFWHHAQPDIDVVNYTPPEELREGLMF